MSLVLNNRAQIGKSLVKLVSVETNIDLNPSDHIPVQAVLDLDVEKKTIPERWIRCKPKWDKCDKQAFGESVKTHLQPFSSFKMTKSSE